jgi:hypothetical protein
MEGGAPDKKKRTRRRLKKEDGGSVPDAVELEYCLSYPMH